MPASPWQLLRAAVVAISLPKFLENLYTLPEYQNQPIFQFLHGPIGTRH